MKKLLISLLPFFFGCSTLHNHPILPGILAIDDCDDTPPKTLQETYQEEALLDLWCFLQRQQAKYQRRLLSSWYTLTPEEKSVLEKLMDNATLQAEETWQTLYGSD